jgi:3-(3-hydroxy-phenyl)propionate hydroxylase
VLTALLDDAGALLLRPDHTVVAAANTPDLRTWQGRLQAAGIRPDSPDGQGAI